jgi:hypothetical protein
MPTQQNLRRIKTENVHKIRLFVAGDKLFKKSFVDITHQLESAF